ncbi:MAG: hypothetical protein AAF363_18725 [Bacteroidota bacterium]
MPIKKIELNKELTDAGFSVKGKPLSSKFVHGKFGLIDFKKISVKQAERLVKAEFEYLTKEENKPEKVKK